MISWFIFFIELKKDTGTHAITWLFLFTYFELLMFLNWLDLNFSELLSKSILNVHENMKEIHVYLQYVWLQAWFHEHLFLVSNTVMKLSWAWVPVHTEIDNIYLQNLWHNGSIDYLRVQTVGHLNCFCFMTRYQFLNQCILSGGRVVWMKKSLTPKEQNVVDCFFFTL